MKVGEDNSERWSKEKQSCCNMEVEGVEVEVEEEVEVEVEV